MGTAGTARLALIAMAFALGAPALAGDSVVDLFREAERGRVAPIVEALESGQHNDDDQALLRARLVADRFDPAVLADAEIRRLATDANDPDQRRIALSLIGAAAFAHADYAAAARAAAAADADNTERLAPVSSTACCPWPLMVRPTRGKPTRS